MLPADGFQVKELRVLFQKRFAPETRRTEAKRSLSSGRNPPVHHGGKKPERRLQLPPICCLTGRWGPPPWRNGEQTKQNQEESIRPRPNLNPRRVKFKSFLLIYSQFLIILRSHLQPSINSRAENNRRINFHLQTSNCGHETTCRFPPQKTVDFNIPSEPLQVQPDTETRPESENNKKYKLILSTHGVAADQIFHWLYSGGFCLNVKINIKTS